MKNTQYTPSFPEFYIFQELRFTPDDLENIINNTEKGIALMKQIPNNDDKHKFFNEVIMGYKLDKMPIEERIIFLRRGDRMGDGDGSFTEKWKHKITQ